ncbi:MAG: M23 family metallopeptidase, partial [Helicobacter sp.]|nr:M23 family metallopeptidase [Helicobacter sp.]
VVIDHGQGIFSMYYHCSELKVSVGDSVKKGDLIALSGNSGRVSGPHLHFGFLVNGAQVDPLDFIDKINLLF